jgi:hypothetical protein
LSMAEIRAAIESELLQAERFLCIEAEFSLI